MDLSMKTAYRHKKFGEYKLDTVADSRPDCAARYGKRKFYQTLGSPSENCCEADFTTPPKHPKIAAERVIFSTNCDWLDASRQYMSPEVNAAMPVQQPSAPRKLAPPPSNTPPITSFARLPQLKLRADKQLVVPKLSVEKIQKICQYHSNMVRAFPKKLRTPKDQERRDKNTIACRMSRRMKKLEHVTLEEQYKQEQEVLLSRTEEAIRLKVAYEQLELLASGGGYEEAGFKCGNLLGSYNSAHLVHDSVKFEEEQKRPFSIAYLIGEQIKTESELDVKSDFSSDDDLLVIDCDVK